MNSKRLSSVRDCTRGKPPPWSTRGAIPGSRGNASLLHRSVCDGGHDPSSDDSSRNLAHVARVFVGRVEVFTPTTIKTVETAIARNDTSILSAYSGMVLGPIMERIPALKRICCWTPHSGITWPRQPAAASREGALDRARSLRSSWPVLSSCRSALRVAAIGSPPQQEEGWLHD